jgi:hypothetical protein
MPNDTPKHEAFPSGDEFVIEAEAPAETEADDNLDTEDVIAGEDDVAEADDDEVADEEPAEYDADAKAHAAQEKEAAARVAVERALYDLEPAEPDAGADDQGDDPDTEPEGMKPAKNAEDDELKPDAGHGKEHDDGEVEADGEAGEHNGAKSVTEGKDGLTQQGSSEQAEDTETAEHTERHVPSLYVDQMNAIDEALDYGADPETIEGYVATGGTSYVFDTPDGNIIKLPRIEDEPMEDEDADEYEAPPQDYVRSVVESLERGKGFQGFEQIVDYIDCTPDNKGAVIVEKVEGKVLDDMSQEEKDQIPVADYERLMDACGEAAARRIKPDFDGSNIIHNSRDGFTIIDYGHLEADEPSVTPKDLVGAFALNNILNWAESQRGTPSHAADNFFEAYRNKLGAETLRDWVYDTRERMGTWGLSDAEINQWLPENTSTEY